MNDLSLANWVMLAIEVVCTIIVSCISFFLKRELNKVEKISDRVHDIEMKMANEYVPKEDFYRSNGEIINRLEYIQGLVLKIYQEKI